MKPSIFLALLVYSSGAFAQHNAGIPTSTAANFSVASISGGNDPFTYGQGIDVNNAKYSEVIGSPFLKRDFTPAFVAFKNGKKYMGVPVKFDMLHNEIDIDKNATLISLIGIDSVSFADSIYDNMVLKTGYPSINRHDTSTFYQIVAQNNKIQLLKYYHCHISTIRTLGLPDKSSFDVDDQYYLYNKATRVIEPVKLNKKSFSSVIADIGFPKADMDKSNINFKSEKAVTDLISSEKL
jgi:hypothetical protein